MFQHRHQHGGNTDHGITAIGRKHFQHEAGLEGLQQHLGRRARHRTDDAADAAAGVEQRHRGDEDVAGLDAHLDSSIGAVVGEPAMMQQRALGKSRGARRILDHHGIGRLDVRQRDAAIVAGGDEGGPVVETNDLAQFRATGCDFTHRIQHRIAAERRHHEHAGGPGLLQHIFDLVGAKAGVDGDQHHAGHRSAELHHHPFRQIVGPDGNPFARLEAAEQGARGALCLAMKLRIGPLAAHRGIGDACDQRDPVRRRLRGLLQQLAERNVADGGGNTRDMRFLQGHYRSRVDFFRLDAVFGN